MSSKQLKIVLWIVFTVLFFVIFCGVEYLLAGSIDWPMAIFFFIVFGLLDKKGISFMVDHYGAKFEDKTK